MKIKTLVVSHFFLTRLWNLAVFVFYFLCIIPACIFAFKKPQYNLDMLTYMALVIKMDYPGINDIHALTYQTAKENIPLYEYQRLTDSSNAYRKKMANSYLDFYKQLLFYVVKPMYIWFVRLFYKSGLSLPAATVLPSVLSYLLSALLLFAWIKRYLRTPMAFISSLLIMYSIFMINTAQLSTPDFLSAFILFASFYFIIEKPAILPVFIFFLLAIFTRIDNILICILLLSFLTFSGKWVKKISLKYYLLMLLSLVSCYLLIAATSAGYGWSKLFYTTFFDHLQLGHKLNAVFSLKEYFALIYSQAITAVISTHLCFFMLLALLLLSDLKTIRFRELSFDQSFLLVLLLNILVRFILFPDLSDRFNISFFLCVLVFIIKYHGEVLTINKTKAINIKSLKS